MSSHLMQLFMCQLPEYDSQGSPVNRARGNVKHVSWALDREDAKRKAQRWMGEDPDHYIVTPLTNRGDRVHLDLTLNV